MPEETEVKITGQLIAVGSDSIGGYNIEVDIEGAPLLFRMPMPKEQVKLFAPYLYENVEITVKVLHE